MLYMYPSESPDPMLYTYNNAIFYHVESSNKIFYKPPFQCLYSLYNYITACTTTLWLTIIHLTYIHYTGCNRKIFLISEVNVKNIIPNAKLFLQNQRTYNLFLFLSDLKMYIASSVLRYYTLHTHFQAFPEVMITHSQYIHWILLPCFFFPLRVLQTRGLPISTEISGNFQGCYFIFVYKSLEYLLPKIIARVMKNCRTCLQMCIHYERHHLILI